MTLKKLQLDQIRIDGGTQQRASINEATVAEYAESIAAGDVFPAPIVFFDGTDHWLAGGFHRWHAYRAAGIDSVDVDVRAGSRRDAVLFSVGDNADHGLRRTGDDKRKAVTALLTDEEWGKWSDREIARQCRVHNSFVSRLRGELSLSDSCTAQIERTYVKNGTVGTMSTGNIGKRPADTLPDTDLPDLDDESLPEPEEPAATPAAAPAPKPAPAAPPAEPEDVGPSEAEIAASRAEENDRLKALEAIVDADDKLKAAVDKITQQAAQIRILQERVRGLTNECAQAIRLAKSWRLKLERSGKA